MGREAWTIPAFGADVAAVVDELRLQRVVFIGHSMGGEVIVEAARRSPDRVAGLIWVDAHKSLGTPRSAAEVDAMVAPMRADFRGTVRGLVSMLFGSGADSALVERVRADMASAPRRVAIPTARAALSFESELLPTLRDLKVPIVAINADNLSTDTASLARYGVTVAILSGCGHFLMLEDPDGFNRMLRSVVKRLLEGGRDAAR
jgi:pimeloyl-ACP methyl ester carboxylesterase